MPRKVVASLYVTLDGFLDEPGRWSMPFWGDEAAQFKARELFASDALLLGRKTYDGFAAAWPTMQGTGEFGERMNSMPKYVASRTLQTPTWNAAVIVGDVTEAVARLKVEDGGDLLIAGSGSLVDQLTEARLIDEYRFLLFPIILGSEGTRRLFGGAKRHTLQLVESVRYTTGVLANTYVPAPS
jgi:dihydrofolate reductase